MAERGGGLVLLDRADGVGDSCRSMHGAYLPGGVELTMLVFNIGNILRRARCICSRSELFVD